MSSRIIYAVLEQYQRARISFVQSVADLAGRQQNVEALKASGVLELVKPLLNDTCPQIQQCAAVAIGRLAHQDADMAQAVIATNDVLPRLIASLVSARQNNKYLKKSALFVIRSICKHDGELAKAVITNGGLEAIIGCLEDFDPDVKQAAAWALGYVARPSGQLAQAVVDAGAVPLLILCLQEPELALKQIAASALADIAKQGGELAQCVVDAGAVPHLARALSMLDEKLKRQVLAALQAISRHSAELAEAVVEAEVFPSVLIHMAHPSAQVRHNAALLVRDVVKHSLELAQLVVNTGGIGALMDALQHAEGAARVATVTALGYIAGHSDQLAFAVAECSAVQELQCLLHQLTSEDDATLAVTAWALGHVGKHSPEHARLVAEAGVLPRLLQLCLSNNSDDLKYKSAVALKQCLQKCVHLPAMEPLLHDAPPDILKYVLAQYSKILPNDPKARRLFVTTGSLRKVQEMHAEPGSKLAEYICIINHCFPDEIVKYYTPGYPDSILEKVEQFTPQLNSVICEGVAIKETSNTSLEEKTPSPVGTF